MIRIAPAALVVALCWRGAFAVGAEADGIKWRRGEFYCRQGGTQGFVLGRNPTGWKVEQFEPLLRWAEDSGERVIRVHMTVGMSPAAAAGAIDEAWAGRWEKVFDLAAARKLRVLPVFTAWADWNDGSGGERWHTWDRNPYNAALGGPAGSPAELFGDTPCRRLWLGWLERLVRRWQGRENILGWEVFSELDLATDATEDAAVEFVRRAAAVIRAADGAGRPVMASLSGIREWPRLFSDEAVDWVQVHPYADGPRYRGKLDEMILETVRARLARYGKPVFIGECGFDSGPPPGTLDDAARAGVGVRHAIWATVVSGAMNGRMLWWADGYDQYSGIDLRTRMAHAARPVAEFVRDVDFAGFKPVAAEATPGVLGGAIGNGGRVIGWYRDARCVGPDWPTRRMTGEAVTLSIPGDAADWRATFVDPTTLQRIGECGLTRREGKVAVPLPAFEKSVVVDLRAGRE